MDDKAMRNMEDALQVSRYAPKSAQEPVSVDDIIEMIESGYKKLGAEIEQLKRRLGESKRLMTDASKIVLSLINTVSR